MPPSEKNSAENILISGYIGAFRHTNTIKNGSLPALRLVAYHSAVSTLRELLKTLTAITVIPAPIDAERLPLQPHKLFEEWFRDAVDAGQPEPHAMTLSTADNDGTPDARIIILKDVTAEGWWFASSGLSAKGVQLAANPHAALTFYWPAAGRAVRLRGSAVASPTGVSAQDFSRRTEAAKAVIIGSPQSEPLNDRFTSEQAVAAAKQRLEKEPSLIFEPWTLWHLQPDTAEFWQADAGRQHIRLTYTRTAQGWNTGMLWA